MHVRYVAPFAVNSGYARAAQDYMMALKRAEVPFSIQPLHDADSDNLEFRYRCLLDRVEDTIDPTHIIIHTVPRFAHEFVTKDLAPPDHVKKICLTTWETDKFPESDAKSLNDNFDAIVVPAEFCADTLVSAGLPVRKVHVVPHGFDPDWWWPETQRPPQSPYSFYWIGVWSERKNPIGLLKAYLTEFTGDEPVVLRILCPDINDEDVERMARCAGLDNLPAVQFVRARLGEVALRHFHETSNCYVNLSRGEAWGLGVFEAAIIGNPVISTDFGGQMSYLDLYKNRSPYVECFLTPAITPEVKAGGPMDVGGIKVQPMKRAIPVGITGDQNWAEPNLNQAKQLMRLAFNGRYGRSDASRKYLAEHFSYQVVGDKLRAVLEAL
jgi:glycosyltransferase involved in cell wall biosynthesis